MLDWAVYYFKFKCYSYLHVLATGVNPLEIIFIGGGGGGGGSIHRTMAHLPQMNRIHSLIYASAIGMFTYLCCDTFNVRKGLWMISDEDQLLNKFIDWLTDHLINNQWD